MVLHVINTQVTKDEKLRLLKACEKRNCTVYKFVKDAVLKEVESELSERRGSARPSDNVETVKVGDKKAKRIRTTRGKEFIEFGGEIYEVE